MKRTPLTRFEMLAQRLVEDSFKRLFGGRLEPMEVAARLARALEDDQQGGAMAEVFAIHLHPDDFAFMSQRDPQISVQLAEYMDRLAGQAGFSRSTPPRVELVEDKRMRRHNMRVVTRKRDPVEERTTQVHRVEVNEEARTASLQALDAFLIVDGRRHVALTNPIVSLGRRIDNDIVLDSAAVSRRHAQIRWRYGRFVLYDLGGRGSTSVNGQPVSESVLKAGDVISLSDVSIIYGEGRQERYARGDKAEDGGDHTLLMPKN